MQSNPLSESTSNPLTTPSKPLSSSSPLSDPSQSLVQPLPSSLDISQLSPIASQTTSQTSQTSQSLVQSILAGVFSPTAYKPSREDLQLTSIARLRAAIEREEQETARPRDTLRKSVFVACVRSCRECLVQFQTKLLLLNVSALL